jgi:restriction system protein
MTTPGRIVFAEIRYSAARLNSSVGESCSIARSSRNCSRSFIASLPAGFEEFALYLLRTFGIELTRVGGVGDEGIDGIGLAPIGAVLSSRVAVQAKRYDPTATVGREIVALFQRDAAAAGAERAVLVTLARFSPAARKAATFTTPTVDLIDGDKLCDLVRDQQIGLRIVAQVDEAWFDRFDA